MTPEEKAQQRLDLAIGTMRDYVAGSQLSAHLHELLQAMEEHYALRLIDETKQPDVIRGAAQGLRQLRRAVFMDRRTDHPPSPVI